MSEFKTCARGFGYYGEFLDTYRSEIRVKMSSSAEEDCCWVFCKDKDGADFPPHLNVAGAKQLIEALQNFINDVETENE